MPMGIDMSALREKFDALSLRERFMLLLALLAVLYQVADMLVLGGQYAELKQLQAQTAQQRQSLSQVVLQVAEMTQSLRNDPNQPVRERHRRIQRRVDEKTGRLQALADKLMAPRRMAATLEQMLAQQGGLQLLSLSTREPRLLNEPAEKNDGQLEEASGTFPVYVHSFVVEFEGSYFATLDYLEALEALDARFYWDRVEFRVAEYPRSRVLLELHTLSLSEDWIGV
jgi:MSHA biogenesis protein MshJ